MPRSHERTLLMGQSRKVSPPKSSRQSKSGQRSATAPRVGSALKRAQAEALRAYLCHRVKDGKARYDQSFKARVAREVGLSASELRDAIDLLVAQKKISLPTWSGGVNIWLKEKARPLPWPWEVKRPQSEHN
jgi:hypothetical protein